MAKMKGYKKADEGMGLGGNPDLNIRPDALNFSKDSTSMGKNEITVTPPATEETLNKEQLLQIMKEEAR
jgi:hypothetical protein